MITSSYITAIVTRGNVMEFIILNIEYLNQHMIETIDISYLYSKLITFVKLVERFGINVIVY